MTTLLDDTNDLNRLMLAVRLGPGFADAPGDRSDEHPMSRSLVAVERQYQNVRTRLSPPCGSVMEAVLYFRKTGGFRTYREGRYVCAGLCLEVSGWCLLGDLKLLERLLGWCRVSEALQRLRFYSCLSRCASSFMAAHGEMPAFWQNGWSLLARWLEDERLGFVAAHRSAGSSPLRDNRDISAIQNKPSAAAGRSMSLHGKGEQGFDGVAAALDNKEECKRPAPVPFMAADQTSPCGNRLYEDEPAWNPPAQQDGAQPDLRCRIKAEPGSNTRLRRRSSRILHGPSQVADQRLDFLLGFTMVIRELSFQLGTLRMD